MGSEEALAGPPVVVAVLLLLLAALGQSSYQSSSSQMAALGGVSQTAALSGLEDSKYRLRLSPRAGLQGFTGAQRGWHMGHPITSTR